MDASATHASAGMDTAPPLAAAGAEPRTPTVLLRELIVVSDLFEERMRRHLTVNQTDLEAMEHLLTSGPLAPSELSRRLGISTASTTVMVDRLVALGHVTRERHPTDRRAIRVVPTKSSAAEAMSVLLPMIGDIDAVLDGFTAEEQDVITEYLRQVVDVYRRHAEPPVGSN